MAFKRNNGSSDGNNKKPKLQEDIDALWGEDWDDYALDDCIKLATQVVAEDKTPSNLSFNISKLPSYNAFLQNARPLTSTQFAPPPSTSNGPPWGAQNTRSHNEDIEALRQKCQEKEGEAAILRSQLAESKKSNAAYQQKLQDEWKRKLEVAEQQAQSVRGELEFKNLEIVNLKHKFSDFKRHTIRIKGGVQVVQTEQSESSSEVSEKNDHKADKNKLYPVPERIYPLKRLDIQENFNLSIKEQYIIETKRLHSYRNTIPYLQNQNRSTKVIVNKADTNLQTILEILLLLVNYSEEEINSDGTTLQLNKILSATYIQLEYLSLMLEEIKSNLQTEDVLEADMKKGFVAGHECLQDDKMGMNAGVLLGFVAEVILYNCYVKEFFYKDKVVSLQRAGWSTETRLKLKRFSGFAFLTKILRIVKLCGEIRLAEFMPKFLISSVKLFKNICKLGHYNEISDIVCSFTKELIFSRPPTVVVFQITYLLREASIHGSFLEFLFNKAQNSSSIKDGIVYFNNDACRFYIFAFLFLNRCNFKADAVPFFVCVNMFYFIYNTYKTSYWMHYENTRECDCLSKLYTLEVEIMHWTLRRLNEGNSTTSLKRKVAIETLSLMIFHSYELTKKYISVFAQCKDIISQVDEGEELNCLDQVNMPQDVLNLTSKDFDKLKF